MCQETRGGWPKNCVKHFRSVSHSWTMKRREGWERSRGSLQPVSVLHCVETVDPPYRRTRPNQGRKNPGVITSGTTCTGTVWSHLFSTVRIVKSRPESFESGLYDIESVSSVPDPSLEPLQRPLLQLVHLSEGPTPTQSSLSFLPETSLQKCSNPDTSVSDPKIGQRTWMIDTVELVHWSRNTYSYI